MQPLSFVANYYQGGWGLVREVYAEMDGGPACALQPKPVLSGRGNKTLGTLKDLGTMLEAACSTPLLAEDILLQAGSSSELS